MASENYYLTHLVSPRSPSSKSCREKSENSSNFQRLKRSPSWSPPNLTSTPLENNQQSNEFRKFQKKRLFSAQFYDLKKAKSTIFVNVSKESADEFSHFSKDSGFCSSVFTENVTNNSVPFETTCNFSKIITLEDGSIVQNDNFVSVKFKKGADCENKKATLSTKNLSNDPRDKKAVEQVLDEILKDVVVGLPEFQIGRRIGEEYFDIISQLVELRCYSILRKIFVCLNESELAKFSAVCSAWKSAILQDSFSRKRLANYIGKLKNVKVFNKENNVPKTVHCSPEKFRSTTHRHKPLDVLHNLGNKLQCATANFFRRSPNKYSPPSGKFDLFVKEAKNLKKEERLMKCPSCEYPAKVFPISDKGCCTNPNCSFEFCSLCRGPFHSSSHNCTVDPNNSRRQNQNIVGSEKSKRTLRRLFH